VDGAHSYSREQRVPHQRALVPAYQGNRGFLEMPARRVGDGTSALLHEIVHIYAPHRNRFLAEGLAVYLHAKLAGNPAFPNFGEDLRRLAARDLPGAETVRALNAVRTPRPLGTVLDEKIAYVLAGSFVGFLIERHGLPQFRACTRLRATRPPTASRSRPSKGTGARACGSDSARAWTSGPGLGEAPSRADEPNKSRHDRAAQAAAASPSPSHRLAPPQVPEPRTDGFIHFVQKPRKLLGEILAHLSSHWPLLRTAVGAPTA
jgi:hypothetical protein